VFVCSQRRISDKINSKSWAFRVFLRLVRKLGRHTNDTQVLEAMAREQSNGRERSELNQYDFLFIWQCVNPARAATRAMRVGVYSVGESEGAP
jgi:hypothetical protein